MSSASIAVTLAGAADRPALMRVLAGMGAYYDEVLGHTRIVAAAEALASPANRAGLFCLIGRAEDEPAGLVALSGFFPARDFTWGPLLHDIFVMAAHRGTRTARALMRGAMRFAANGKYSRVEWGTAEENLRARAFYTKLGVAPTAQLSYRLEDEALAEAAQGRWPVPEEDT
ncbi:MAG: GNAT family N-acetyltransferase [Alphaproteobacteria bacterium]|nr:GNAT family N-acetyltransferase [Alphaproteobacteria bacterium]